MSAIPGLWRPAGLALFFLLMLPDLELPDLAIAAALAAGILLLLPAPELGWKRAAAGPGRLRAAAALTAEVVVQAARGTWNVAGMALGLTRPPTPGFVELPIGDRTRLGAAVNGLLVTLSPGTLLIDIDEEKGSMLFHVAGLGRAEFEQSAERLYRHQRTLLP